MDEDEYREPDAGDDPALAFARVEDRLASVHGEVGLLRAAIAGLAATRESIEIPDYEPTLARTEKVLGVLVQQIDPIAKSPLLSMTPHNMAGEIVSAALHARREDQRLIAEARTGLDQAAREVGNRLASARRGDVCQSACKRGSDSILMNLARSMAGFPAQEPSHVKSASTFLGDPTRLHDCCVVGVRGRSDNPGP